MVRKLDEDIQDALTRGVEIFTDPGNSFQKKLEAKARGEYSKDIIIKLGVDPTAPNIHLGHAAIFRKLRKFQDLGAKVVFLVGDFTAQIGDPTGKNKVRPELDQKKIEENAKTFIDQVGKILRTESSVFSWIRNSDWFIEASDLEPQEGIIVQIFNRGINPRSFAGKAILYEKTRMQKTHLNRSEIVGVTLRSFLSILRKITHGQLIERDMFQKRLKEGGELYMHEMMYPVLQGVDSHVIAKVYGSCDLEIGGTDQTFNMHMGRDVMKIAGQEQQAVLAVKLLTGTDGTEKMSKSLENYIGITDAPEDMYGKTMSIPDKLIPEYFELATYTPSDDIQHLKEELSKGTLHPRDLKMRLAREIVAIYHGEERARQAEASFVKTFSEGGVPEHMPTLRATSDSFLDDLLLREKLIESKSEFRRLQKEGAISLDGVKINDAPKVPVLPGVLKIGKHRFVKIEVEA